jgi:hypothetical protein
MTDDPFDDVVALLKAHDEVGGWEPNAPAAFARLAAELPGSSGTGAAASAGPGDVVQVSIGDLSVIHRPEPTVQDDRRRLPGQVWLTAAAVVVLAAAGLLVNHAVTTGNDGPSHLRVVSPLTSTSPTHATATTPAQTRRPSSAAVAPVHTSSAGAVAAVAAPLQVHVSVSKTSLHPGDSLVVTYSWSDGDGRLLNLNHVESTALKVTRPPACGAQTHVLHPGSGHGSYTFTFVYPPPNGGVLLAGFSLPFDHPERIQVGVDINTGGGCAPEQEKTAAQWVTLLPPTTSATPAASPSPTPTSTGG